MHTHTGQFIPSAATLRLVSWRVCVFVWRARACTRDMTSHGDGDSSGDPLTHFGTTIHQQAQEDISIYYPAHSYPTDWVIGVGISCTANSGGRLHMRAVVRALFIMPYV